MFGADFFSRRKTPIRRRLPSVDGAAARYVSSNASRRIGRLLSAGALTLSLFIASALYAEEKLGDALELAKETELLKTPTPSAQSLGRLPEGTILNAQGERNRGFVHVTVELEGGEVLEGWIDQSTLATDDSSKTIVPKKRGKEPEAKRERVPIPEDEALLLRREPTFFYGLQLGFNLGIIQSEVSSLFYMGPGFTGGAHIGTYLSPKMPIRLELNFTQVNGSNSADPIDYAFNFMEIAVIPSYIISGIELFAGLQYAVGMGMGNIPIQISISSASELSSLGFVAGAGLRFPLSPQADLLFRGKYNIQFIRFPFSFQTITGMAYLEIRG